MYTSNRPILANTQRTKAGSPLSKPYTNSHLQQHVHLAASPDILRYLTQPSLYEINNLKDENQRLLGYKEQAPPRLPTLLAPTSPRPTLPLLSSLSSIIPSGRRGQVEGD